MKKFSKKASDISICVLCFLISFSFFLLLIFGSHKDFSERENRALQKPPKLSFSALADGSFFRKLSNFSSDQFPFRPLFCSLSSLSELALLRNECNGIIIADEGQLISRHDEKANVLSSNLDAISSFFESHGDLPSFLLVAPRAIDVEKENLPSLFYEDYGKNSYDVLHERIANEKLIEIQEQLKNLSQNGEQTWYATDHHWTTRGAYETYLCLCKKLGKSAYSPEYFNVECVTKDFLGTSFSRSGLPESHLNADTIELYRYSGDDDIEVIYPTAKKTVYGFYDMTALERKDKYQIFLGGNTDLLQIRDPSKGKPRMLLIKDSFANCLIPFLALHYDIDVIDLRYYKSSLKKFTENKTFDTILVVYGIDTLGSQGSCAHITK